MSEKREHILLAALHLFAEEGYTATATSKVAKAAGVSEGLIFRHFGNKEGLLRAVLHEGEVRMAKLFDTILWETNPARLLAKTLSLPFRVAESEYPFWRLQYRLKWELNLATTAQTEPLMAVLAQALGKLNYPSPQLEAKFIIDLLDGVSGSLLRGELGEKDAFLSYLLSKYNV